MDETMRTSQRKRVYRFNPDNVTWASDNGETVRIGFVAGPCLTFHCDEDLVAYQNAVNALAGAGLETIVGNPNEL